MPKPSSKPDTVDGFDPRSPGDKKFIKKHVVQKHKDPNGNGDEVFKASNIKFGGRFPHHGYEPGQDKAVYEAVIKGIIAKVVANNTKEQPKPDDIFRKTPEGKKFPAKTKETFVNEVKRTKHGIPMDVHKNWMAVIDSTHGYNKRDRVLGKIKDHIKNSKNKEELAARATKSHLDRANSSHTNDQFVRTMNAATDSSEKETTQANIRKNWQKRYKDPKRMKNFFKGKARPLHEILKRTKGDE